QILHDLRLTSDAGIDSATLQRLAEFSNAQTIVSGQYARFGNQIRIDASLRDLRRDRTIPLRADAPNENGLPAAIDELAQDIRKNLPLSASIIKELEAQAFKPSTRSLAALRNYDEGLQLLRQGRNLEAQKKLAASTQQDPQFALAFA